MSRAASSARRKTTRSRVSSRPARVAAAKRGSEPAASEEVAVPEQSEPPPMAVEPEAPVAESAPRASTARVGLRLEPSCLLRDALDMQFQLLSADFGEGDVMVDGSAVERVDTAGLQLLLAFVNDHEQKGRRVAWTDSSAELRRAAARLGLAESLRLPADGEAAP